MLVLWIEKCALPFKFLTTLLFQAKLTYLQKLPAWVYRHCLHHSQVECEPRKKHFIFLHEKYQCRWHKQCLSISMWLSLYVHMYIFSDTHQLVCMQKRPWPLIFKQVSVASQEWERRKRFIGYDTVPWNLSVLSQIKLLSSLNEDWCRKASNSQEMRLHFYPAAS